MEKLLSAYNISTSALVSVIVTPNTQKDTRLQIMYYSLQNRKVCFLSVQIRGRQTRSSLKTLWYLDEIKNDN